MPRGVASKDGDTHTAPNGYHYTRVNGKFRLTHHIIAEQVLGRAIASDETVRFVDGDRSNHRPDNIKVTKRKTSDAGKLAAIEAKILELQGEAEVIRARIARKLVKET